MLLLHNDAKKTQFIGLNVETDQHCLYRHKKSIKIHYCFVTLELKENQQMIASLKDEKTHQAQTIQMITLRMEEMERSMKKLERSIRTMQRPIEATKTGSRIAICFDN